MMISSTLQERLQLEKMSICSCQRERAIYYCNEPSCPSKSTQPYYCDECAEMVEEKHPHAPKKIVREISTYSQEWLTVKRAISSNVKEAEQRFGEQGALIRYLERALISMPRFDGAFQFKSLLLEFDALRNLHERLERYFSEDVEPFIITFRVGELLELRGQCAEFAQEGAKYEYLSNVSDGTIWDFYHPAIEFAGSEAFVGFSQDNKDTYNRLKVRSLEERLLKYSQLQGAPQVYPSLAAPQELQHATPGGEGASDDTRITKVENQMKLLANLQANIENGRAPIIKEMQESINKSKDEIEKEKKALGNHEQMVYMLIQENKELKAVVQQMGEKLGNLLAIKEQKVRKRALRFRLEGSKILTNNEKAQFVISALKDLYNEPIFKLVYRATKHGDSAQAYHKNCDNKGALLYIVKSQNQGRVFGAYTSLSQDSLGQYKNDNKAFIWSLDLNRKFAPSQFVNTNLCNGSYGPYFGSTPDFYLASNFLTSTHQMTQNGIYNLPLPMTVTGGVGNAFQIEEFEVYQVKAKGDDDASDDDE
ncbi:hypothetical protein FGO68_gene4124 [Halteria grandinella]|uniref:TLDc domain-containing protein n=1 Tax=Halteria grandinella TaxID=5974 RepID=A0A8J8NYA1_HALGN|nr:hypothetical protein FGO68_gene4124 [Halteria grandinella]